MSGIPDLLAIAAVPVLLLAYLTFVVIAFRDSESVFAAIYGVLAFLSVSAALWVSATSKVTDQPGLRWGCVSAMVFLMMVAAINLGRYFRTRSTLRKPVRR